jgi:hypothetical protein
VQLSHDQIERVPGRLDGIGESSIDVSCNNGVAHQADVQEARTEELSTEFIFNLQS